MDNHKSIDAIITWVDGDDADHLEQRRSHLHKLGKYSINYDPAGMSPTRFKNNGEIKYCVYSIRKFLPWIRKIYLVTNGQIPDFLKTNEASSLGIEIVDHKTIFQGYEWALPTFNSVSIENMLYRIPGIADQYIYFNDDCIAISPMSECDFFVGERVVLRGKWMPLKKYGRIRSLISGIANMVYRTLSLRERSMHILRQYRAAYLAGLDGRYIEAPHVPHPVNTQTLTNFFSSDDNLRKLRANISYRFRNLNQFVCHPLANYIEIVRGNFKLPDKVDYLTIVFSNQGDRVSEGKIDLLGNREYKLLCIQNLEKAQPQDRAKVERFLDDVIFNDHGKI